MKKARELMKGLLRNMGNDVKKILRYDDILGYDVELYNLIKNKYGTDENAWKLFVASYIDPDGYSDNGIKKKKEIKLTSDALLSIKRIKSMEGFGDCFIESFKRYRKNPIFYFPCEVGGINQLRARKLEDRIDHTLFDIKHHLEEEGECKCILRDAYKKPKTGEWLRNYKKNFKELVNDMGIYGIFVNEKYEVYNLEKKNGDILKKLKDKYVGPRNKNYLTEWSKEYYKNVKAKIDQYEDIIKKEYSPPSES